MRNLSVSSVPLWPASVEIDRSGQRAIRDGLERCIRPSRRWNGNAWRTLCSFVPGTRPAFSHGVASRSDHVEAVQQPLEESAIVHERTERDRGDRDDLRES